MGSDEDTEGLREAQRKRELAEQHLADQHLAGSAADEEEFAQHQRRAEKANYLRRKLEERAESETQDG